MPLVAEETLGAWQKIDGQAAEALVVDLRFDEGGAQEILARLATSRRFFTVVALCDYDFPVNELPSLGRIKVLTKPVPAEQVVSALETLEKQKAKSKTSKKAGKKAGRKAGRKKR